MLIVGSISFFVHVFIKPDTSGSLFTFPSEYPTSLWINPDQSVLSNQAEFQLNVTSQENYEATCEFKAMFNVKVNNWNHVAFSVDMERGKLSVYVEGVVKVSQAFVIA